MSQKAFCATRPQLVLEHSLSYCCSDPSADNEDCVSVYAASIGVFYSQSILKGFLLLLDLYLPQRQQTDRQTLTDKQTNNMKQRRE